MGRSDLCCGRIGTSFRARRWLSLDPCGFLCITLSLSVHVFALVTITLKLISNSNVARGLFFGVYIPTAILALSSLWMAWTTNPGAVPMGARPLTTFRRSGSELALRPTQRGTRRCSKCNDNFKPPRAHHDSVTGRCIVKMDHYCPWVGNAIGALNHKFFVLFIFYTLLTSIQALVLIVIRLVRCGYIHQEEDSTEKSSTENDWDNTAESDKSLFDPSRWLVRPNNHVYPDCNGLYDYNLVVLLFIASVVFLLFTCAMLMEQIDAIQSNTGKIARMKMRVGQGGTELRRVTHAFNEMFGGDSSRVSWHWFLPLPVRFPKGMDAVVLGYEWDESFEPVPYHDPKEEDEVDVEAPVIIIGDEGGLNDLESGLTADPNKPALGDGNDDSSFASISSTKGVRKRDSFQAQDETSQSLVDRIENRLT